MTVRGWVLWMAAVVVVCGHGFAYGADQEELCQPAWASWGQAFNGMKDFMDRYRRIKEGPVAQEIRAEMSKGAGSRDIARCVRVALEERVASLNDAARQCRESARLESSAFEAWRRCLVQGRIDRRAQSQRPALDAADRERKSLLANLEDLLLDEGYAQYKDYKPPTPPAYWGGYEQAWGGQPGYQNQQGYQGQYRGYR